MWLILSHSCEIVTTLDVVMFSGNLFELLVRDVRVLEGSVDGDLVGRDVAIGLQKMG